MSKKSGLDLAVEQATHEVKQASVAVVAGASPEEAFADKVDEGPRASLHEAVAACRQSKGGGSFLLLNYGDSQQRWMISSSGNVLVPVVDGTVASALGSAPSTDDHKARIEALSEGASAGGHARDILIELDELAVKVQRMTSLPAAVSPQLALALKPSESVLAFIPPLLTMAVLTWLKICRPKTNPLARAASPRRAIPP